MLLFAIHAPLWASDHLPGACRESSIKIPFTGPSGTRMILILVSTPASRGRHSLLETSLELCSEVRLHFDFSPLPFSESLPI